MKRDCACPRARHQHGTLGAYRRDGCGCLPCRAARATSRNNGVYTDHRMMLGIGVQRRLRALARIGWGAAPLATGLGVPVKSVERWRRGDYPTVMPETAARIAALYDRLWDRPPAPCSGTTRARAAAARAGWAPPLAWDDDTIDDPAATPQHQVRGGHAATERVEGRAAEVDHLSAYLSASEIAVRLGVAERTVVRDRARGRAA